MPPEHNSFPPFPTGSPARPTRRTTPPPAILSVSAGRELVIPDLIALNVPCHTKADAIALAVTLLHAAGRTTEPEALEQSLWQREAISPTVLEHGFALPHCKSRAVLADSLVILRPRTSLDWESPGQPPVRLIIFIVSTEVLHPGGHLRRLAQLARQLLDAPFREGLQSAANAIALCDFLNASPASSTA